MLPLQQWEQWDAFWDVVASQMVMLCGTTSTKIIGPDLILSGFLLNGAKLKLDANIVPNIIWWAAKWLV